jgi:hypothetical protein
MANMAIDSYVGGVVLIGASALAAVIGLLVVRKTYNNQALASAHQLSGQYLAIVGTLYAVLLGLIVVDAMARFEQAVNIVEDEANAIAELIYLSGRMPASRAERVTKLAIEYVNLVADQEWPRLREGRPLESAPVHAFDLMRSARDWEPVSESEKAIYASAIEVASEFWNARRHRIVASQRGIPALEWCLVIVGGIVTVSLTYVFVFDELRIQITLTAMVALLISLNIFLIVSFGHPFSGDMSISPKRFQVALANIPVATPAPEAR